MEQFSRIGSGVDCTIRLSAAAVASIALAPSLAKAQPGSPHWSDELAHQGVGDGPITLSFEIMCGGDGPNALGRACYPDFDVSTGAGELDVLDFLAFQALFIEGDLSVCDCDASTGFGVCDVFDFICFQSAFAAGCGKK